MITPIRFFRNHGLNIRWVQVPSSLQSAVGDNEAAQVHLSAQLAVGDSGDHLVAAEDDAGDDDSDDGTEETEESYGEFNRCEFCGRPCVFWLPGPECYVCWSEH